MKKRLVLCIIVMVTTVAMTSLASGASSQRIADADLEFVLGSGCKCDTTTPVSCPIVDCTLGKANKCIYVAFSSMSCTNGTASCGDSTICGSYCG
jgi:hypothetical protein